MEVCKSIFQKVEIENIEVNEDIYNSVLQEFLDGIDVTFTFKNCPTAASKVRELQKQYIYTSDYVDLFFTLLMKYNYRMRHEIKDAMFRLGHLKAPNKNSELIRNLLNSPVIQDISFDGRSTFTISSEQYGDFVFELASYFFRKNKRMRKYMRNNPLPNRCHNHAYFMSEVFADFYAITSICEHYFRGYYYHSYICDRETNSIIDLCYNGIMDKLLYDELFQAQEISVILNSMVQQELALTNLKTAQDHNRCELLKIALYKQYLDSIGYTGSLEEAPSIKVKK